MRTPRHLLVLVASAAFGLAAGAAPATPVSEVHYTMGTYFSIRTEGMPEAPARAAMRQCFTEARRLEGIFSRFDRDSELSRLNANNEADRARLSETMADLLRRALLLRDATDGTFDVTIGALTALWRDSVTWPPAAAVRRDGIGDRVERVRLHDRELVRVRPGVELDFDGVAKGYAVDRCVALLRAAGVARALVSLGESSQYALGAAEGQKGWQVLVRGTDPGTVLGTLELRDQALSASAVLGHSRELAGRRVGHIIDPETGRPLRANALAIVVADNATDAEAYSKAVLIWGGRARGQLAARLERSPRPSLAGALYVDDGKVTGWRGNAIHFRPYPRPRPLTATQEPLS
jgi:thiamine biosynthesis lipoprotein